MLTAKIEVNGALVAYLYIVNKGVADKRQHRYHVMYYRIGEPAAVTREVLHDRSNGPEKLVLKALRSVSNEPSEAQ